MTEKEIKEFIKENMDKDVVTDVVGTSDIAKIVINILQEFSEKIAEGLNAQTDVFINTLDDESEKRLIKSFIAIFNKMLNLSVEYGVDYIMGNLLDFFINRDKNDQDDMSECDGVA